MPKTSTLAEKSIRQMQYNNAKAQQQAELENKKSRILDDIMRKEENEFKKK